MNVYNKARSVQGHYLAAHRIGLQTLRVLASYTDHLCTTSDEADHMTSKCQTREPYTFDVAYLQPSVQGRRMVIIHCVPKKHPRHFRL